MKRHNKDSIPKRHNHTCLYQPIKIGTFPTLLSLTKQKYFIMWNKIKPSPAEELRSKQLSLYGQWL